jgi:hypothetical protein
MAEPKVDGARPPTQVDLAIVMVATVVGILEAALRPEVPWRWPTLAVVIGLFTLLPHRRQHPLRTVLVWFGIGLSLDLARIITGETRSTGLHATAVMLLSLYALGRWASGRHGLIGVAAAFVVATVASALDARGWSDVVGGYAVLGGTIAAGLAVRFRSHARTRAMGQIRLVGHRHPSTGRRGASRDHGVSST